MKHLERRPIRMHIFFAANDSYAQHLGVAMTSIVKNTFSCDEVCFYILDGGISDNNKMKIKRLENNRVIIEYLPVDDKLFSDLPIWLSNTTNNTVKCKHVSIQTYYRYLIPKLKPELEKVIYLDCDLVIHAPLNELWNADIGDNYIGAVEDMYMHTKESMKIKVDPIFNAGVLLINNKKWIENNICDLLFENTRRLSDKIVYVDQDILNYTFNGNVYWLEPKYNLQQNAWYDGVWSLYDDEQINYAKARPVVAHFNGPYKPWNRYYKCRYEHRNLYGVYLKRSPFFFSWIKWKAIRFIQKLLHKDRIRRNF
jgi:lipopolysaccharide biosynthesis glycosyltransferase